MVAYYLVHGDSCLLITEVIMKSMLKNFSYFLMVGHHREGSMKHLFIFDLFPQVAFN